VLVRTLVILSPGQVRLPDKLLQGDVAEVAAIATHKYSLFSLDLRLLGLRFRARFWNRFTITFAANMEVIPPRSAMLTRLLASFAWPLSNRHRKISFPDL